MNIETAKWCHNELRENLPGPAGDARDALDDVVKLHWPVEEVGRLTFIRCQECFNEEPFGPSWPCSTIVAINAYAHIDLPRA
jgi:hypothetical protein